MRDIPSKPPVGPAPGAPGDFYPPNRLGEIVSAPGGLDVNEALRRAGQALQAGELSQLARIDEAMAELRRLAAGESAPSQANQLSMYDRANEIVSLAVTVSCRELSEAAYSLCELLDSQRLNGVWRRERVDIHLAALALLRAPSTGADRERRAAMLAGLRSLSGAR